MSARIAFFALVLSASAAHAQVVKPVPVQPTKGNDPVPVAPGHLENQHEEVSGYGPYGGFKIVYDRDGARRTQLRFTSPEPMTVRVTDGVTDVLRDTIPTKLDAHAGRLYRVQISNGRELVFDQTITAKEGMIGQLEVTIAKPVVVLPTPVPTPIPAKVRPSPVYPAPSGRRECMNFNVTRAFADNIQEANALDDKIWLVRDFTRRQGYYFCVAQVFTTLKLFESSRQQLEVLSLVAPLIIDPKNNFKIPQLFRTDDERDEARRILAASER